MAFAGLFLDGEGAFFGGSGAQGAGCARRRRLCLRFRLRAKGGSAVVGAGRGCRGGQGGRQAVRRSRTTPPAGGGGGSAPEGRSACRPCACGKGAFGVRAMPVPFGAFARGGSREARGPRSRQ